MGEPQQSNNVRRIDFAKGGAKSPRVEGGDSQGRLQGGDQASNIIPLPAPQGRRRASRPVGNALTAVVVLLSALFGALTAVALLHSTF